MAEYFAVVEADEPIEYDTGWELTVRVGVVDSTGREFGGSTFTSSGDWEEEEYDSAVEGLGYRRIGAWRRGDGVNGSAAVAPLSELTENRNDPRWPLLDGLG